MKCIKRSLYLSVATFCLLFSSTATLQKVQAQSDQTKNHGRISQGFKPPKRQGGAPVSGGGASRGSLYVNGKNRITPLIPANKLGLTFAQRPTFFWYLPSTSVKTAKFLLLTDNDQKVFYETNLTLPNRAGIISYTLPLSSPPLVMGKTYHWYLTLVEDAEDFSNNPRVEGWVERTQPESSLAQVLAKADRRRLPTIYAEAGIWHEALTSLVQLRRSEPRNLQVLLNWRQFLQSVGLDAIASQPLINCCQSENASIKK